jgi:hypothetical protein
LNRAEILVVCTNFLDANVMNETEARIVGEIDIPCSGVYIIEQKLI